MLQEEGGRQSSTFSPSANHLYSSPGPFQRGPNCGLSALLRSQDTIISASYWQGYRTHFRHLSPVTSSLKPVLTSAFLVILSLGKGPLTPKLPAQLSP